jgi:hypothetical protein
VVTLVSIVTPTMPGREALLLDRCIPSVTRLHWPGVEHVIVSDPNPALREEIEGYRLVSVAAGGGGPVPVRFVELNDTWRDGVRERSVGAVPWMVGSLLAQGEFVGFLGDDDELLPHHVNRHVDAMVATGADFTISPIEFRVGGEPRQVIGDALAHGHLDATGIMCRREALRAANWTATGEDAADWRLVDDWLKAGLKGHLIGGEPTGIHNDGWMAR